MKLLKRIGIGIKNIFKRNSKALDKFSEELFAKGVDELVKGLSKTLPSTKKALLDIIQKNFISKFKNVPVVNDKLNELFKLFEVKVKSVKLCNIVKSLGEYSKQGFNDLYKPEEEK